MLPALGAASLALDAVQSLTSPAASSSSRSADAFAPALSANAPSSSAAAVSGFGSTQISSDNINTLLDAQSLTPHGLGGAFGAGDLTSDSSRTASVFASGTASSAYNAINQLTQSTALPLGLSAFSVSV